MEEIVRDFLEKLGLGSNVVYLLVFTSFSLPFIFKGIKFGVIERNRRLLNHNLKPYFSTEDVSQATSYQVHQRFQNVSPDESDTPQKYIAAAKGEILPLFLNEVFYSYEDEDKYYFVFADSGMGKTNFMINIYLRHKNRLDLFGTKPNIILLPLGWKNALDYLNEVSDKKNTILLLDAFDEDEIAIEDHRKRLEEIVKATSEFQCIIFTCRTQFFPTEEEMPSDAGYLRTYGDGQTEYKFQKLYLCVFSDKDIKNYLRKRFSLLAYRKRLKAKAVINQCRDLVVRPMLLKHVNDLVERNVKFNHTYEIYHQMIKRWIERESDKNYVKDKYIDPLLYRKLLYEFSQTLAIDLYKRRKERGGFYINHDEKIPAVLQISEVAIYEDTYTDRQLKSKSLLNRNTLNQYKFAHKSIFEYFLAKQCYNDLTFLKEFDFKGMSAAQNFYHEMITASLESIKGIVKAQRIIKGKKSEIITQPANIKIIDLPNIVCLEIHDFGNQNLLFLSSISNLKELVIADKVNLTILRQLLLMNYFGGEFEPPYRRFRRRLRNEGVWLIDRYLDNFENLFMSYETRNRIYAIQDIFMQKYELEKERELGIKRQEKYLKKINLIGDFPRLRRLIIRDSLIGLDLRDQSEYNLLVRKKNDQNEQLRKFLRKKVQSLGTIGNQDLNAVNSFLKDIELLEKKLPDCQIYY